MRVMDFWKVKIEPYCQKSFWNGCFPCFLKTKSLMNIFLNIYFGLFAYGLYEFSF